MWYSIKDTEVGWPAIERRTDAGAFKMFGFKEAPTIDSEILDGHECKEYFKNCYFVSNVGKIFSSEGRFLNATQFNGRYGGKHFIITSTGKTTDEAWKAATRSTLWNIPKVDHTRFLPELPLFEQVYDELGRKGLNTYIPATIDSRAGDISPWLKHLENILPDANDREILTAYLAHTVKYPGVKIQYAPMIQSAEGVGKTVFFEVMQHALGRMYVYTPKAELLAKSGNTFNAWMRGKLFIVVNEVKVDERRELIEILKPMITDSRIEVQSKGVDQEMEDNVANWLFFSNYKDAIPITANGRRYAILFSPLQSAADLLRAGMNDDYFNNLWTWLRKGGGLQAITHYLLNYPIARGGLPVRAPKTSSYEEALRIGRSPMEIIISDCVADEVAGFRNGYVSSLALANKCKASGMRAPGASAIASCLSGMGYVSIGRADRPWMQEDITNRTQLWSLDALKDVREYGKAQGYC